MRDKIYVILVNVFVSLVEKPIGLSANDLICGSPAARAQGADESLTESAFVPFHLAELNCDNSQSPPQIRMSPSTDFQTFPFRWDSATLSPSEKSNSTFATMPQFGHYHGTMHLMTNAAECASNFYYYASLATGIRRKFRPDHRD